MRFIKNIYTHISFSCFSVENISIDSCDGSSKNGPYIYIDFHKINRPCTCKVNASFTGDLLVISNGEIKEKCNTQVNVVNYMYNYILFRCPIREISSATIDVQINQSVVVQSEYSPPYTSGSFYHCLGFRQNSMFVYLSFFIDINKYCCVKVCIITCFLSCIYAFRGIIWKY